MGIAKKDVEKKQLYDESESKRYEVFAYNLRLLRAARGISADNLAKELGFKKQSRLSDLEYRRSAVPKIQELEAIGKYFGVTIDELLYKKGKISFESNDKQATAPAPLRTWSEDWF